MRSSDLGRAVAAEVRAEMARQRVTGAALAREIGVNEMWVSRRINDKTGITFDDLAAITVALDTTPWQLLDRVRNHRVAAGQN